MHCFPHQEDSGNSTSLHFTLVEIDVGGTGQEGGAGALNTVETHTQALRRQSELSCSIHLTFFNIFQRTGEKSGDASAAEVAPISSSLCRCLRITIQVGCVHNSSTRVRLMIMLT